MKTRLSILAISILIIQTSLYAQTQIGADIDGDTVNERSGFTVALNANGTIVATGSLFYDNFTGRVRVFQWSGSSWDQIGQDINGEAMGDDSGHVSFNDAGNILAVGASYNDGGGSDSGHVRVFEYDGNNWIQLGQDIDGEAAGDFSGWSFELNASGSILASGARGNDGNGSGAGHVRVFEYDGNIWVQLGQDIDGVAVNDSFGEVAIDSDGNRIAVGASGNDTTGNNAGQVTVFDFDGNNWNQIGSAINGEESDSNSGLAVSLSYSGNTVAIGAPFNSGGIGDAGHVRVFYYDGNDWSQLGQDIDGEQVADRSGKHHQVGISGSGTILAIGSSFNDGNGTDSGHVRVFQYDGANWIQRGQDIDGEHMDDSAAILSLSKTGNIVGIGSSLNDDNGTDTGHVRVFDLSAVLSVDEISNELNITLYPNPANDYVNINGVTTELSLRVYDVSGREVLTANVTNRIDVRSLITGTYFIKLSDGNKTSTHKLIKY